MHDKTLRAGKAHQSSASASKMHCRPLAPGNRQRQTPDKTKCTTPTKISAIGKHKQKNKGNQHFPAHGGGGRLGGGNGELL